MASPWTSSRILSPVRKDGRIRFSRSPETILSIVYDTDSSRDSRRTCSTTVGWELSIRSVRPLTACATRSHIPRFAWCRNSARIAPPPITPNSRATRIAGIKRKWPRTGCEETIGIGD